MSSIATVDRLLASWDLLAAQIDAPPAQSLLLVSRDDELYFERKPKRSFSERLTRFVQGVPKSENFCSQIEKLKNIFQACDQQDCTQKDKCSRLAEHINTLGRYAFAQRVEKTILASRLPRLAEYQIRAYSGTSVLTAPGTLKRGLQNPDLKFCWLNATLKFFAATTYYDTMLTTRAEDAQLELLRKALFRMVDALRKNWDQHLINALHQELIDTLRTSAFGHFCTGEQQDATEFIIQLKAHFPIKNPPTIEFATLYERMEQFWKPGFLQETDKIEITPPDEYRFRLEEAYSTKNHLEGVREYYEGDVPNNTDETLDFIGYDAITRYPQHLEVLVKRYLPNNQVRQAKIEFDEGGQMTVLEHEPELLANTDLLIGAKAKTLLVYKVVAAIERPGGRLSRGHYIAHTRAPDGTITTHNDAFITTNKAETVWENAYYLLLECTSRMPIPE